MGFQRAARGLREGKELRKETGALHPAGVRNLQSQPLGRAGAPLPDPYHPRPRLRRRRRQNQLLLGSRSGSRSAETAGREVSSALLHARPDPHPAFSRVSGNPTSARIPSAATSSLGRDSGAQALVCLGIREVRSQRSGGGQRSHQPRLSAERMGRGFRKQDPYPSFYQKPIPTLPCLSFPLGERMRLISTRELVVRSETVVRWRVGGIGPISLASPPKRVPLLPAPAAPDNGVGRSGGLGRRTE